MRNCRKLKHETILNTIKKKKDISKGHRLRADLSLASMWWKKIIAEVQFYTQVNNSAKNKTK